jgi:hypothetical protein
MLDPDPDPQHRLFVQYKRDISRSFAHALVNWDKTGSVKENKTKLSVVLIITV